MKSKLFLLSSVLAGAASFSFGAGPEPLLNQIQVIGSHNSYKKAIDPKLFAVLQKADSAGMSKIDYSHAPLTEQLNLGLRALEIDGTRRGATQDG